MSRAYYTKKKKNHGKITFLTNSPFTLNGFVGVIAFPNHLSNYMIFVLILKRNKFRNPLDNNTKIRKKK